MQRLSRETEMALCPVANGLADVSPQKNRVPQTLLEKSRLKAFPPLQIRTAQAKRCTTSARLLLLDGIEDMRGTKVERKLPQPDPCDWQPTRSPPRAQDEQCIRGTQRLKQFGFQLAPTQRERQIPQPGRPRCCSKDERQTDSRPRRRNRACRKAGETASSWQSKA